MLATDPYLALLYLFRTARNSSGIDDCSDNTARAAGRTSISPYRACLSRVGLQFLRPTVLRAIRTEAAASWLGRYRSRP